MEENQQAQVVELQPKQNGHVQPVEVIEYVPSLAMSMEQAKDLIEELDQIKDDVLRAGKDYDTIPGTQKPTLLKPGAERLLQLFGLGHRVQCVEKKEDWEKGFFYYRYKVSITKTYPTYEIIVAECEGSANSKEAKFAYRWVPDYKLKEQGITNPDGLEYRTKKGRYGTYKEYKVPNPDPYSLVNTLQKMAIKRALVGAALQATGTSEFFTQDVEDIEGVAREAITEAESTPQEEPETKANQQTNQPKTNQQANRRTQNSQQNQNGQRTEQQNEDDNKATAKQRRAIYAIGLKKGLTKEQITQLVRYLVKRQDTEETPLTKEEAAKVIDTFDQKSGDELINMLGEKAIEAEIENELKELGVE